MACPLAENRESTCILPGGNSGDYFSDHYDDQLRMWADGEYKSMSRDAEGDVEIRFASAEKPTEEGDE